MTEMSYEDYEAMADVQSDKDDLTAMFLWQRLLSFEGLPNDARSYAEEVIGLYRRRIAVRGRRASSACEGLEDGAVSTYETNMLLRMFIGKLEDIEKLGVSNEAREKIAKSIKLFKESIAE